MEEIKQERKGEGEYLVRRGMEEKMVGPNSFDSRLAKFRPLDLERK